MVLNRILEHS